MGIFFRKELFDSVEIPGSDCLVPTQDCGELLRWFFGCPHCRQVALDEKLTSKVEAIYHAIPPDMNGTGRVS